MYKRLRSITVFLLVIFYSISAVFAQSDTTRKVEWSILPHEHLVPLFTADSRAHRLTIQKNIGSNGFIGSMGGIFPIFRVEKNKNAFQFSVASTVYTTLYRWTDRGQVENVDFFVDLFGDFRLNDHWALRGSLGHTSQHLADDALVDENMTPINYTRDYAQLLGDYQNVKYRFRIYGGLTYNENMKAGNNIYGVVLMPQFGFEHSPVKWFLHNYLYYAADVKFRGEHDYRTTQNYQIGYKYALEKQRTFRFAFDHSRGLEERGQFYMQTRNFSRMGVYFDF